MLCPLCSSPLTIERVPSDPGAGVFVGGTDYRCENPACDYRRFVTDADRDERAADAAFERQRERTP